MTGLVLLLAASGFCGPVVISEVMFHPQEGTGDAEFVELVNLGDTAVDLTGWSLADLYSTDDLDGSQLLLGPGEAAVIFEADYDTTASGLYYNLVPGDALILLVDDSQIGNRLGNAGDTLFLIDALGDTVDTVGWDQDITPGYSLEKVILDSCALPGNWRHSTVALGTPGAPNSVADLPISYPPLTMVINEIMYLPFSGQPEWVELYNLSSTTVELAGWRIRDSDTVRAGAFLPPARILYEDYIVLLGDEARAAMMGSEVNPVVVPGFPALNNTGDLVVLLDPNAAVIDQVDYGLFPLTTAGRSLEKVSPAAPSQETTSWVISPASQGHTAGGRNSVLLDLDNTELTLEPNPLQLNTPASILAVKYVTPFPAINLVVEIYDLAGRRLGTIFNEGPVPGAGVVTWDARSLDPVRYRTGQYLLLFRARDTGSGQRWEFMERLIVVR